MPRRGGKGGEVPWHLRYGTTIVHELGHVIMPGADHVDCKGTEESGGGLDPNYPYPAPNCSMAAVDPEGFYAEAIERAPSAGTTG